MFASCLEKEPHLGAAFNAGDNCLEHGHERCFAQSRRPRDDRQSVQRHRGGVRVQGGDCDERGDCAPSVAAADEGSAARHQRQHLRANSNFKFKFKLGSNVEGRSAGGTGNLWTVGRGLVAFGRSLLETVHVQPLQYNDILTPNSYSCRFPAINEHDALPKSSSAHLRSTVELILKPAPPASQGLPDVKNTRFMLHGVALFESFLRMISKLSQGLFFGR